jgi:hypothetical protein
MRTRGLRALVLNSISDWSPVFSQVMYTVPPISISRVPHRMPIGRVTT